MGRSTSKVCTGKVFSIIRIILHKSCVNAVAGILRCIKIWAGAHQRYVQERFAVITPQGKAASGLARGMVDLIRGVPGVINLGLSAIGFVSHSVL